MSILNRAWCRTFQAVFNVGARVLPWRKAEVVDGSGSIDKIPELLDRLSATRPLIVTDQGLVRIGLAERIFQVLDSADVTYRVYDQVEPNPSVNTVEAIVEQYHAHGCDSLIALGGGSPMDAAKAAAARIVRPRKTVNQLGGLLRVRRRIPPFIAVPTTAGTGSETTIAALITDTDTHHKYALMDLSLIPRYAVLDANLTLGLPPHLTATTGMDALTHAIEAYLCWTYYTKESQGFAKEAVTAIFENLMTVYKDGSNIEARQQMMLASYKAGFAFTRAGVGNIHAIAHTLGGLYDTPHGLANAVLLPIVLEDYGEAVYPKLAQLAQLAGVAEGANNKEQAQSFIRAIREMNARMDIPDGFDFIKEEDIPQMVEWALDECNPIYPVPVIYTRERCTAVIEKARKKNEKSESLTPFDAHNINDNCIGCLACIRVCPVMAITGTLKEKHHINPARCVNCGACGRVCAVKAVEDNQGRITTRLPRSQWPKPVVDPQRCSACSICVAVCTLGALEIAPPAFKGDIDVSAQLVDPNKCVYCKQCEIHCPVGAIELVPVAAIKEESVHV